MKIVGKKVLFGDRLTNTQKNYLQQRISALARYLHSKGYKVKMKTSIRTDSIYLYVNKKTISFRNHQGDDDYHSVFISSFSSWKECKSYVLDSIIPKCGIPRKLTYNFLDDVKTNEMTDNSEEKHKEEEKNIKENTESLFELDTEVLKYLKTIENNMENMYTTIQKVPQNKGNKGNLKYATNLVKNTKRNITKIKMAVK